MMQLQNNSTSKRIGPIAILLCAILLVGCGSSKPSVSINDAPADVQTIYKEANCISCHGSELQGRVGSSTNLQQIGARLSVEDIISRIEDGKYPMPAYKNALTEEEINKLASWLSDIK